MLLSSATGFFPWTHLSFSHVSSQTVCFPDTPASVTTSVSDTTNSYFLFQTFLHRSLKPSLHSSLLDSPKHSQISPLIQSIMILTKLEYLWSLLVCSSPIPCLSTVTAFTLAFHLYWSFSWVTHSGLSPGKQYWPVRCFTLNWSDFVRKSSFQFRNKFLSL